MLTLNDGRIELWQWDTGRTLAVDADCTQVHFSNKVFGRSIDVDVVDGVSYIPDVLLQTDKDLTAWAFVGTAENGYTKISKVFKVNKRNKPADYVFTPPEQTMLAEIMDRLDDMEATQDPDAIKNAVEDYLEQNPVEAPVQSVNGKTGGVKLTAEDVGAISQDKLREATNEALAQAKASGEFDGLDGKSAYQIAVDNGFRGSEAEWLESLKGGGGTSVSDAVLYTEQELTEEQKAQARANIGVIGSAAVFESILELLKHATYDSNMSDRLDELNTLIKPKDSVYKWLVGFNGSYASGTNEAILVPNNPNRAICVAENTGIPLSYGENYKVTGISPYSPVVIPEGAVSITVKCPGLKISFNELELLSDNKWYRLFANDSTAVDNEVTYSFQSDRATALYVKLRPPTGISVVNVTGSPDITFNY